jgi:hypothetical protein
LPVSTWVEKNGLALAIQPQAREIKPGETLRVTVLVKNISTNPFAIFKIPAFGNRLEMTTVTGQDPTNILTTISDPAPPSVGRFVRLKPGELCSGEANASLHASHDFRNPHWKPKYLRLTIGDFDYDLPPGDYLVRFYLREFKEERIREEKGWVPFEKALQAKHWTGELMSAPVPIIVKDR